MAQRHRHPAARLFQLLALLVSSVCVSDLRAEAARRVLPLQRMLSGELTATPVANSAFVPGPDAKPAPPFSGVVVIDAAALQSLPQLQTPVIDGRDAARLPAVRLEFLTMDQLLVPVERGEMVRETGAARTPSYWRQIPQFGRIWREPGDGQWSRAAFPLMLVNDTENHAHQGLATFLYREGRVSGLRVQFVQQTAPYLLKPHTVLWGSATAHWLPGDANQLEARRNAARVELARRLPVQPWSALVKDIPAGTLDGFGGPLKPKWMVQAALVRNGTLFYQDSPTPYGPYPYPLEMRFGVRSVMKSVGAPLALLRLAEVYGPYVLTLRIGDFVKGLDPKFDRIRFVDAANMASGFGGVGSLVTHPNDGFAGYLDGDYDAWYTAPSQAEKLAQINRSWKPYPWEPGTVWRYRDQDFYLLGVALDAFLKSVRGPDADIWRMLQAEVFAPIGILHAPAVRTREAGGKDGLVWFNAGYYPSLDDLAKIALLYQNAGAHAGKQLLHRQLTLQLLAADGALVKSGDRSIARHGSAAAGLEPAYLMGLHFTPYKGSRSGQDFLLPTMSGSGDNEVILYPNKIISIRTAKAAQLPPGEVASTDDELATLKAVDRLEPF